MRPVLTRTLPLRVDPLPGEALDSWLEAVSARTDTPFGQTLHHLGFPSRTQQSRGAGDLRPPDWTILLRDEEAHRLARASGLTPETITAMTLVRYFPHAIHLDLERRHVDRKLLWGRGSGSRYCPDCLREHQGRWQLFWRLGWAFACTRHRRLLADDCPDCGRFPRHRPHSGQSVPRPGFCGHAPRQPGAPYTRGCGHRLANTSSLQLTEKHPALQAQKQLKEIIENPTVITSGAYTHRPQTTRQVLLDIRAVAQRVLTNLPDEYLPELLPDDLITAYLRSKSSASSVPHHPRPGFLSPGEPARRPGFMAPTRATSTAVAVTIALHILNDPDVRTGGALIRTIHQARRPHLTQPVIASSIEDWGRELSPVLEAIHLASIAPTLRPSLQLRYRTATGFPRRPEAGPSPARERARKVPTICWPPWTARLGTLDGYPPRTLASALSVLLLTTGQDMTFKNAIDRLSSPIDPLTVSRVTRRLVRQQSWNELSLALTHLADHLDDRPAVIDYERRRTLDYEQLLPDHRWQEILTRTAAPADLTRLIGAARNGLIRRISGTQQELVIRKASASAAQLRSQQAQFRRLAPPETLAALEREAQEFLTGQGIKGEPVAWVPPLHLLDGLQISGTDTASRAIPLPHALDTYGLCSDSQQYGADFTPEPTGSIGLSPTEVLAPAMTSRYAWLRLERFAAATAYPSMMQAAAEIGAPARQLSEHALRLERELGRKLLVRATSKTPQRLTPDGEQLVTAICAVSAEEVTQLVRQKRRTVPETADEPAVQSDGT
ncbi:TniQ family protein [Streptomyces sp. NPDC002536]